MCLNLFKILGWLLNLVSLNYTGFMVTKATHDSLMLRWEAPGSGGSDTYELQTRLVNTEREFTQVSCC